MISRFTCIRGNDTSRGKGIWRQLDRPATACIDFNRKTSLPKPPSTCIKHVAGWPCGSSFLLYLPPLPLFWFFQNDLFPSLSRTAPEQHSEVVLESALACLLHSKSEAQLGGRSNRALAEAVWGFA
jgi:hypothetical protein